MSSPRSLTQTTLPGYVEVVGDEKEKNSASIPICCCPIILGCLLIGGIIEGISNGLSFLGRRIGCKSPTRSRMPPADNKL